MTSSERLVDDALTAVRQPADVLANYVMTRWTEIVAPELSRFIVPSSIRGATLWLRPLTREARLALSPLAATICDAIARATGSTRIKEVRFVDDEPRVIRRAKRPR